MNNIGNNLRRIRLLKNLSLREAGNLLHMSATAISKYEKGEIIPDSTKVIEFAEAYDVKCIDILKVYDLPKMKFTSFRKNSNLQGQKLSLLKEMIAEEVGKYEEIISLGNINYKNFKLKKYSCSSITETSDIADKFRKYLGISNRQPISDLISTLENLGFLIIEIDNIDNNFDGFDGLSEVVDGIPVIVLLDDIKDGARQRFTIAHELGHLIIEIENDDDSEKICNEFAANLLMPKEAVINEFGESRKNISFYELKAFKDEYKVSFSAILNRLKNLHVISEYLYKELSKSLNKIVGSMDSKPIEAEVSNQFRKLVHKLEVNKVISTNKACELLGVTADEYNREDNNY